MKFLLIMLLITSNSYALTQDEGKLFIQKYLYAMDKHDTKSLQELTTDRFYELYLSKNLKKLKDSKYKTYKDIEIKTKVEKAAYHNNKFLIEVEGLHTKYLIIRTKNSIKIEQKIHEDI